MIDKANTQIEITMNMIIILTLTRPTRACKTRHYKLVHTYRPIKHSVRQCFPYRKIFERDYVPLRRVKEYTKSEMKLNGGLMKYSTFLILIYYTSCH